ncbi:TetR family transcription regulator (plasmid) [Natrialba magadii ATCC 43099]|uniref:TetR family transcription regulator n=1 Tax=Natrialba magadii (strain ATCC 43099 / DSM 3394 / CCM 3739 / CIP 104546 / IAM 13178 / JCM 8861 / NBRC 102185 / NCIMB 2190 / MS3) TaxID=547559 RepID=D3T1H0_NATMM|nr:TetR/AcrR family transcriptional regulator [Natrialba magadii]ADD07429.1 TetR family transcription regulator [Natrialba magadii ATCC 43099]ELY32237.1 TetR family transcriptional regulator [Natrialba magadii ATCC 43099]
MADTSDTDHTATIAEERDDTTEAIMEAVYLALSKHGYPETTMSRIAAEFEKSKSLLYYHYDGKEEILNDFFAFVCEELETSFEDDTHDDPFEQLTDLLTRILPADLDDEAIQFRQAFFEIRSQAPHNQSYYDQILRTDEIFITALTETLEWGVESGRFVDIDPERQAELIFSTVSGIMERGVTLEDQALIERNRAVLLDQLEQTLLAAEGCDDA